MYVFWLKLINCFVYSLIHVFPCRYVHIYARYRFSLKHCVQLHRCNKGHRVISYNIYFAFDIPIVHLIQCKCCKMTDATACECLCIDQISADCQLFHFCICIIANITGNKSIDKKKGFFKIFKHQKITSNAAALMNFAIIEKGNNSIIS